MWPRGRRLISPPRLSVAPSWYCCDPRTQGDHCVRHCSGTAQSFPKKIRFARRPCAKPPPPRSGRRGPGQISSGASPASPRPDCLDPGPSSKSAEKGGPGPAGPPCRRIGVVAVEPPAPPVWTLILGVRAPPKSDPKGSNFSGFLDPCGAKSRGGGGGSAHYPDPTAQSVEPVYAERRRRPAGPRGRFGTPRAPVRPRPAGRPRLCLLGWLILRPLRGGVVKVAAAPFGVGDPRPGTRVPSRARG